MVIYESITPYSVTQVNRRFSILLNIVPVVLLSFFSIGLYAETPLTSEDLVLTYSDMAPVSPTSISNSLTNVNTASLRKEDFSCSCIFASRIGAPGGDVCVQPRDLIISEIMQNPNAVSDADGEWFEVYNTTDYDISVGHNATLRITDGVSTHIVTETLTIPAKGYWIFAKNGTFADNGGIVADYVYSDITLGDDSGFLRLYCETGFEWDLVSWDGGPNFPDPTGMTMSLDSAKLDGVLNDTGSNWCTGTATYGAGDRGTPGAANVVEAADAGVNQAKCNTTNGILAGNSPIAGTGNWTVIAGTATVSSSGAYNSNVSGLIVGTNTFRWTITNGSCVSSDDISIVISAPPTVSAAGTDQTLCNTTTSTLGGNNPSVGTGAWTVIAGPATVTSPGTYNSGVTGMRLGTNTFRWTITNGACSSLDDITIVVSSPPTSSDAGDDQALCNTTNARLAGNNPGVGTGAWTRTAGTGTVTSPGTYNSLVSGLGWGTNTFRWTITNGACTSMDDISIVISALPTFSDAGMDQALCNTTTSTLAGNNPSVGTGAWTVTVGPATVTNPGTHNSGVTGLIVGTNTFRWTTTNGTCISTNDITIVVSAPPTLSSAGMDTALCNITTYTLGGNNPDVGTGAWTVIAGTATVTDTGTFNSGVTGLIVGTNTFRWTIFSGACTPSTDDVEIVVNSNPTCTIAGSTSVPEDITGLMYSGPAGMASYSWMISGNGNITSSTTSQTVTVTSTSAGTYTLTLEVTAPGTGCMTTCMQDVTVTLSAESKNRLTGGDPCNCADLLNCDNGGVLYFHDVLRIPAVGTTTPGMNLRIEMASDFYIDVACNGSILMLPSLSGNNAAAGTQIMETGVGSGVYEIEFWKSEVALPSLVIDAYSGGPQIINDMAFPDSTFEPLCMRDTCPNPIPTLGQWGLIMLGLFLMILGIAGVKNWQIVG